MKFPSLLDGLTDQEVMLTPDERRAVRQAVRRAVHEQYSRYRWSTLARTLPGWLPLLLIPFWLHLRKSYGVIWDAFAEMLLVSIYLAIFWWWLRFIYRRHARQALRELGYADICPRCGYDVSQLEEGVNRCPECAATFEPFRDARDASRAPR